jgi:hypothetical protein
MTAGTRPIADMLRAQETPTIRVKPLCPDCHGRGWVYVTGLDGEREKDPCPMGCDDPRPDAEVRASLRAAIVGDGWQPDALDFRRPSGWESDAGEPRGRMGR